MDALTRRTALRAAAGTAGLAMAAPGVATAAPGNARQRAFAAAAEEFGVPEPVLLAVSYLTSRWDAHGGRPSTGAGYGPMHLTDLRTAAAGGSHHDQGTEDPRGDTARPALRPATPPHTESVPELQTVDLASRLTGVSQATLRTDPAQNIRGGAAVLAAYHRELGVGGSRPDDFYGAVARYSGASTEPAAAFFADEVFAVIASGLQRVTDDGERVRLDATEVRPDRSQLRSLGLRIAPATYPEGPAGLPVEWIPAPYQKLSDDPSHYGNHDKANRPESQRIRHIVIHDTECSYDAAIGLVQDPAYLAWHYTVRSADGHIAQHIETKDVGWHAGNWYVNATSIGVEHEGYAAQGTWYTEAMYRASARIVRYLADTYDIPLDRHHIVGHDNVPAATPDRVAAMHWDPGPYWDWAHYFELLGAPLRPWPGWHTGLVMITPDFATNRPAFTGCDTENPAAACPAAGSSAIVLRTEPREDAPLLSDIGLHPDGSPSTMDVSDVGSRVSTGQVYAVAEVQGDWTAIWYLGQKGWFHNPASAPTARPTLGAVVTAKSDGIGVYGRAYPEPEAYPPGITPQELTPLQYTMPAGQRYAAGPVVPSEYYAATTFDAEEHVVVRGRTKYVQIQFGHRLAYVKLDDVRLSRV